MGKRWLEINAAVVIQHLVELPAGFKSNLSHINTVCVRNCILFILNQTLGRMLQDNALLHVAKIFCSLGNQYITKATAASSGEGEKKSSNYQNELVIILMFLSSTVLKLNTAVLPLVVSDSSTTASSAPSKWGILLDVVYAALLHQSQAVQLAAAWCLRCVGKTLQTELINLLDHTLHKLHHLRGSQDAVNGYSAAVAGLVGCVRLSQLGLPTSKIKVSNQLRTLSPPTMLISCPYCVTSN